MGLAASCALSCWFVKAAITIAASNPMMISTTEQLDERDSALLC